MVLRVDLRLNLTSLVVLLLSLNIWFRYTIKGLAVFMTLGMGLALVEVGNLELIGLMMAFIMRLAFVLPIHVLPRLWRRTGVDETEQSIDQIRLLGVGARRRGRRRVFAVMRRWGAKARRGRRVFSMGRRRWMLPIMRSIGARRRRVVTSVRRRWWRTLAEGRRVGEVRPSMVRGRGRVLAVSSVVAMSWVLREMRLLALAVLALWTVSMGPWFVRSWTTIDRLCCTLHLVNDSSNYTLQAVTVLDASVPAKGFGKALLLSADFMRQLSHLPFHKVQLGHLGVKVDIVVVVAVIAVLLWFALADRVKAGHDGVSFDVGDPNGCDLLEPESKADILDGLAVDVIDVQIDKLFLGLAVPSNACEVPGRINNILVHSQRTTAILGQILAVDGHISVATCVARL